MARLGLRQPNRPIVIRGAYMVAPSLADATITRSRTVTTAATGTDPRPGRPVVVQDLARAYRARLFTDLITVIAPPVDLSGAATTATTTRTRTVSATAARTDTGAVTITRSRAVTPAGSDTATPGPPVRPIVVQDRSSALRARLGYDVVTIVAPPIDVTPATTGIVAITRSRTITTAAASVDPAARARPLVVQDLDRAYRARLRTDPVQIITAQVDADTAPQAGDVTVSRIRSITTAATETPPAGPRRALVVSDAGASFRARLRYDVITVVIPPVDVSAPAAGTVAGTRIRTVTAAAARSDTAAVTITRSRSAATAAGGAAPGTGAVTRTRLRSVTVAASASTPATASRTRIRTVAVTATVVGIGGDLCISTRPVAGLSISRRSSPALTGSRRGAATLTGGGQ